MTGQQVNSLPDVEVPMQNYTILQYFVVHAAHGVKAYQVNFPTQEMSRQLEFPTWSYCQNTEDCTKDQQPYENSPGIHFVEPFHMVYLFFSISFSYSSRRAVPSINTLLPHSIQKTFDN
jgi:hypothetical protein